MKTVIRRIVGVVWSVAIVALSLVATVLVAAPASAQTFEKLFDFPTAPLNLRHPISGLAAGSDGMLYGITIGSIGRHNNGALYQFDPATDTVSILHQFYAGEVEFTQRVTEPDPTPLVVGDVVYGVCGGGGAHDAGFVFRWDPTSGFAPIHSFNHGDGADPVGDLLLSSDGSIYGICELGGTNQAGVVYRIGPHGEFGVVYDFTTTVGQGYEPNTGLSEDGAGNLYGTTDLGGSSFNGVVYKLTWNSASAAGFDYSVIHDFGLAPSTGSQPETKLLVLPGGTIYGATFHGGPGHEGLIYRITRAGNYQVVYKFGTGHNGKPQGSLVMTGDGTIWAAGTGREVAGHIILAPGSILGIAPDGTQRYLHVMGSSDGEKPVGSFLVAADGSIYGTCARGGASDKGTIFRIMMP